MSEPLTLTGTILIAADDELTAAVQLLGDDRPRATAVAHWKGWRPR